EPWCGLCNEESVQLVTMGESHTFPAEPPQNFLPSPCPETRPRSGASLAWLCGSIVYVLPMELGGLTLESSTLEDHDSGASSITVAQKSTYRIARGRLAKWRW